MWDTRLTWSAHVNQLKAKCGKIVSLLRSISANDWGAEQQSLIMLHRTLLRSKVEYGYIVYSSAAASTVKPLQALTSKALRIPTTRCVFLTTPIDSLHIITNEMPADLRKEYLTLKYFFKVLSQLSNSAIQAAVILNNRRLFHNKNLTPTFAVRAHEIIESINIRSKGIKPEFSYQIRGISNPTRDSAAL